MDWDGLATLIQSQLKDQIELFVRKIHQQAKEIQQLKDQLQQFEYSHRQRIPSPSPSPALVSSRIHAHGANGCSSPAPMVAGHVDGVNGEMEEIPSSHGVEEEDQIQNGNSHHQQTTPSNKHATSAHVASLIAPSSTTLEGQSTTAALTIPQARLNGSAKRSASPSSHLHQSTNGLNDTASHAIDFTAHRSKRARHTSPPREPSPPFAVPSKNNATTASSALPNMQGMETQSIEPLSAAMVIDSSTPVKVSVHPPNGAAAVATSVPPPSSTSSSHMEHQEAFDILFGGMDETTVTASSNMPDEHHLGNMNHGKQAHHAPIAPAALESTSAHHAPSPTHPAPPSSAQVEHSPNGVRPSSPSKPSAAIHLLSSALPAPTLITPPTNATPAGTPHQSPIQASVIDSTPSSTPSPIVAPSFADRAIADELAASGITHANRGEWKLSLQKLDDAIGMMSKYSWALVPISWFKQRSVVNAKLSHNEAAFQDAHRLIQYYPNNWTGYYILSTLFGRDRKYVDALEECKKAWKRVPKRKTLLSSTATAISTTELMRLEKEAEADRKKIIDRIRQFEMRIKGTTPCVLNEDEDVEDENDDRPHLNVVDDSTGVIHPSPPRRIDQSAYPTTPQQPQRNGDQLDQHHNYLAAPSSASTRASTQPISPNGTMAPLTDSHTHASSTTKKSLNFTSPSSTPPTSSHLSLGMYKMSGSSCLQSVTAALRLGYRRFDTASSYMNEDLLGRALTLSGVPRQEIHITSKIAWSDMTSEEVAYKSGLMSLKKLDTKYLDTLLIHFPGRSRTEKSSPLHSTSRVATWRACERLYSEGRVRSIGVANFEIAHLIPLIAQAKIKPRVNQIELHPLIYQTQKSLIQYCEEKGIHIEAYSSLGTGDRILLESPLLASIAKSHQRSIPEILLQWSIQHGFTPIFKSLSPSHLQTNYQVESRPFTLSADAMLQLDEMELTQGKKRFAWDPTKYA